MTYHDSMKAYYESYMSTDCGQHRLVLQFSLINKCVWDSQEDKALILRSLVVTQKKRIVYDGCEIAIVLKKWVAFVGSSIPQGLSFYDGSWYMDNGEKHPSEGESFVNSKVTICVADMGYFLPVDDQYEMTYQPLRKVIFLVATVHTYRWLELP